MCTRVRWEFSLGLVPFLCLAVAIQAASHAQTAPAHVQPAAAKAAPAEATPAKPATQGDEAKESGDRGFNTGIKVHGWWVIEVRNRDGRVVTHREFENKLEGAEGAQVIMNGIGGTGEEGQWMIALPIPCSASNFCVLGQSGEPGPQSVPLAGDLISSFGGASTLNCQGAPAGTCQQTLQLTVNNPIGTLKLSGSVVAASSGSIGAVETATQQCYGPLNSGPPTVSVQACQQIAPSSAQYFTGTTITPVPFSAGQTIDVAVTISFQ